MLDKKLQGVIIPFVTKLVLMSYVLNPQLGVLDPQLGALSLKVLSDQFLPPKAQDLGSK